jgi:hypothetical protein
MAFGGDDWVLKLMGTEERASCSGLMFWKILINRSTHRSMPMMATPEGRNVWILGDGVGSRQNVQYFWQDFILSQFRVLEKKPKQRLLAPH